MTVQDSQSNHDDLEPKKSISSQASAARASKQHKPTWKSWLLRWSMAGLIAGVSFSAGAAITGFLAVRILAPIAVSGMTMGVLGMAQASGSATLNALALGDSQTRLDVLKQLKQSIEAAPQPTFDATAMQWIRPSLEACRSDENPEVVRLANELIHLIESQSETQEAHSDVGETVDEWTSTDE